ncbi:MAG: hypothetical protein F6J93_01160 [Oscillatoria sp. SIO1A7]|nr:hypothetical protein [Oscillatoria sp. SIO1A7]
MNYFVFLIPPSSHTHTQFKTQRIPRNKLSCFVGRASRLSQTQFVGRPSYREMMEKYLFGNPSELKI